jgi:hypothetical protein
LEILPSQSAHMKQHKRCGGRWCHESL